MTTTTAYQANSAIKMDYQIKPLTEDFVDSVSEIERECFSTPFSKNDILSYLKNDIWHFFACFSNDKLLGYISFTLIIDEISICNVAVSESHRGKGVGSALVGYLLDFARKNQVKSLFLEVRESNINAISLYKKFGFEKTGLSKNHYSSPTENAILMGLEL